jgi:hypothetical protein
VAGFAAVGADQQSALVVEVADGAFDDPALSAEAGAVLALAPCDRVPDAACSQQPTVLVVVIAAVGHDARGPVTGPADRASYMRNRIYERQQLGDVVAIGARHAPGQKQTAGVGQEVVFDTRAAAVDRARAKPAAPFFACT